MCECGGPSRENLQPGGAAPSPCPPPPLVQTSAEGRRGPPWLHGPKEEGLGGLRASVWSWLVCRCASVVPLRPHSPPVFTILGSHLIPKVWARAELSQSPLGDANVPAARKPERGCGGTGRLPPHSGRVPLDAPRMSQVPHIENVPSEGGSRQTPVIHGMAPTHQAPQDRNQGVTSQSYPHHSPHQPSHGVGSQRKPLHL